MLTKIPQPIENYRLEELDDELLLYHPAAETIIYCNQTASLVWQLCDGQRSGQEIVALLQAAYPDTAEAIAADVEATLRQFAEHGAIRLQ